MKFARLFDTCAKHQILARIVVTGPDEAHLEVSTYVEEVGMIGVNLEFDTFDDTLGAFNATTEGVAKKVIAGALDDLRNEMRDGEVTH